MSANDPKQTFVKIDEAGYDSATRKADVDAIEKLIEDDFVASNAGDNEALLSLRTDDAVEGYSS